MDIERRAFLTTIGGAVAIQTISSDALADSLEHYMIGQLDQSRASATAERPYRRAVGSLFVLQGSAGEKLAPMHQTDSG